MFGPLMGHKVGSIVAEKEEQEQKQKQNNAKIALQR